MTALARKRNVFGRAGFHMSRFLFANPFGARWYHPSIHPFGARWYPCVSLCPAVSTCVCVLFGERTSCFLEFGEFSGMYVRSPQCEGRIYF